MKPIAKFLVPAVALAALTGCAVVPAEPGYVYAQPPVAVPVAPPAATVVVRPAYRPYHRYGYGWRGGRW